MIAAAQQPGAGDVHGKAQAGDRDRLGEVDRHRREQAADRLIADQQRDHRQDDRAGEAGEVAELAGAEGEARIVGVPARVAVGQRRQQQGAGMGAHVQPVGDQGDRAEQQAADDLGDHHGAAEPDHRPGAALALLMALAEEDVACDRRRDGGLAIVMARLISDRCGRRRAVARRLRLFERAGMRFGIDEVGAHMVLDDFRHQPGHGAARAGDQVHHLLAAGLAVERALDGLDLAPNAAHARQQLVLVFQGMGHDVL